MVTLCIGTATGVRSVAKHDACDIIPENVAEELVIKVLMVNEVLLASAVQEEN